MITEEVVRGALRQVKYPGYSRDIISFGLVKQVSVDGAAVTVAIELTNQKAELGAQIKAEVERALRSIPGVGQAVVEMRGGGGASPAVAGSQQQKIKGLNKIVAVASGKGGVGKSTAAVNLACALRLMGLRVGLLDCDIYGPSVPLMMGASGKPMVTPEEKLTPLEAHGVRLMSMGFLIDGDMPVIWRGPMITKTIQQFFFTVDWGTLDILLVDLPPGTGDAQLSLCQTVPLDGGVVITTPQEASLGVVRKGIGMFQKVNVPILGIVENMSYFTAPGGERVEIFGHGGGAAEAVRQGVPFLGEVPIYTSIREGGDKGVPVVVGEPDGGAARAFMAVAEALRRQVG